MPLIIIILFGILSASFSLFIELIAFSLSMLSGSLSSAFSPFAFEGTFSAMTLFSLLGVALIEETSKYIFLRQYALRYLREMSTSVRGALLLGTLFGLGFASLETFLTVQTGIGTPVFSLFGTAGIHIVTSLIFASYLLRFSRRPFLAPGLIATTVVLHTLYNIAVFFFL